MAAAMVLVFPTRRAVFGEAAQRLRATAHGGALAVAIPGVFVLSPHPPVLLAAIALGGLLPGRLVMEERHPSTVHQHAFSVALALAAGALSTRGAGHARLTRIVLSAAGALSAALLVALLDAATGWRAGDGRIGRGAEASA